MSEKPVLLIVAGPNGSGKTRSRINYGRDGLDLGFYINPDDIARRLIGDYREQVAAAQRIADKLREDCLERHQSFSFERLCRIHRKSKFFAGRECLDTRTSSTSYVPKRRN